MRHTISILVENKFGVLTRIAGMFSGRGFNIDTLNVGPTLDPETSRMTIVVRGDDKVLDQVNKQLDKLVNVISVEDFGESDYVDRELVLIRVKADAKARAEIMQICDIFRAKIIDVQSKIREQDRQVPCPDGAVRHHRTDPHRQDRPLPYELISPSPITHSPSPTNHTTNPCLPKSTLTRMPT